MKTIRKTVRCAGALVALATVLVAIMPERSQGQQDTPPPPSAPRPVHFPTPVERTLRNGLRVVTVERKEVPLVTAEMLIKAGGAADPAQLAGLADMTAALLTKGTATRSAPQIAEAIEALGGALNSEARWDASSASINVMSSRFEPAMEILADVVRHPTFKDEEIERLRQQTLDDLNVELRDPGALARFVAERVVFGDEPYGHPLAGTLESVARIKRDDIIRLHDAYYRPDNAILVIGGDIKPEKAFQIAERLFGDWAKPSTPLPVSNAESTASSTDNKLRVIVIDKPDAGQAAVVVARRGIKRTDPDYFRGLVANSVLGGGYSSRLNEEIRVKRGLSYGAGSALDARRDVGPFIEATQTKNQSGAEVASILVSELGRLSSAPIPETELTPRKSALTGNFARALETTDGLVGEVASLALYGLSFNEINDFISNVQRVTAGDVQRFAGSRIDAKDARVIIVGNGREFLNDLRKQFPNVEVIPVAELDLNSANLRRPNSVGATKK